MSDDGRVCDGRTVRTRSQDLDWEDGGGTWDVSREVPHRSHIRNCLNVVQQGEQTNPGRSLKIKVTEDYCGLYFKFTEC